MNRHKVLLGGLLGLVLGVVATSPAVLQIAPEAGGLPDSPATAAAPASFADVVERVLPAVVSVSAYGPLARTPPRALGSGFLVSPDGYIVTNNHVVQGAARVRVTLADKRVLDARIVGRDPPTDLALLKTAGQDLPFVSFAKAGAPRVGDWVIAVGSPFGLGGTATAGIVSAYDRDIGPPWVRFLQIDAPINRGNSGGPAFDIRGRVVGVNTGILSAQGGSAGIGFAIPAPLAAKVIETLRTDGRVARGRLGVTVAELDPDRALAAGLPAAGALVLGVDRAGPADRAGLRVGDVVMALNGRRIESSADMLRRVADAGPGGVLRLRVARGPERLDVMARAEERPG